MRIRSKLLCSYLLLTIIPITTLAIISYLNASRTLFDQANSQLVKLTKKSVEQMDVFIDICLSNTKELATKSMSSMAFLLAEFDEDLSPTTSSFRNYIEEHKYISQIRLLTRQGKEILTTLKTGQNKTRDESTSKWFMQASLNDNIYISETYRSPDTNEAVITMTTAVVEQGEKKGLLAIDIKNSAITSYVDNITTGETGYGYIINKDGVILAHPQKNKILVENLSQSSSESLRNVINKMMLLEKGTGKYLYEGIDKYVFYEPYERFNWSIGITIPTKELMSGAYTLMKIIFAVSFAVIIITIFVSLLISKTITNPVREVISILAVLAEGGGNLTQRIMIVSKDEIGELANLFNKFIGTLHLMVSQVRSTAKKVTTSAQNLSAIAQQVNTSTVEISSTIQKVSKGVSTQASKMEDTSKIMQNMSASVNQVVTNAQSAAKASEKTTITAKEGRNLANQAVDKMSKIDIVIGTSADGIKKLTGRSKQISEIVNILTTIADQTNLLALNAAIEAARAGESGRGFAVVAEEVRKLAEGSASSAKNIGKLVAEIQNETIETANSMETGTKEIAQGVKIVNEVGSALGQIVNAAQEVSLLVNQIASSSGEQLKGTKDVSISVREVTTISEESASAAQEATATTQEQTASMQEMSSSAQELSKIASDLETMVAKFRL
ncbi:MAG: methyl-accepting chemotaxis protein [Candidatus Omnitrophota bacterium]